MSREPQTPEDWPGRCPVCGGLLNVDALHPLAEIECLACGVRIGFVRLKGVVQAYPVSFPAIDVTPEAIQRELVSVFPETVAREWHVCPLIIADSVIVATEEPHNDDLREMLRFVINRNVDFLSADKDMIEFMIEKLYGENP